VTGQLDGKVATGTGASSGVGEAVALELGRQGAGVAVNYHGSIGDANAVLRLFVLALAWFRGCTIRRSRNTYQERRFRHPYIPGIDAVPLMRGTDRGTTSVARWPAAVCVQVDR